jgi:hypothetical protein
MSDEKSPQSWWSSLPGVLTASATAITAIGGLIAILGQQGLFHKSATETPPVVASAPANAAASTVASAPLVAAVIKDAAASGGIASAPATASALPVAVAPPAPGNIGSNMTYFAGNWQNANPSANGILKLQIRIVDSNMYVRAWAKCRPTDCDLGEVQAEGIGSNLGSQPGVGMREVTARFKNNIREVALTIHPAPNNHIRVEAVSNFIDKSGRAPLAKMFVFQRM